MFILTEYLDGGRYGKIKKTEGFIHRPSDVHTPSVHGFLKYMYSKGFFKVPFPYRENENGDEIVSYIPGEVYNGILPEHIRSEETLRSVAVLLKEYHDHSASYIDLLEGDEIWTLSAPKPHEVMCHGDFAPYNVVFEGDHPKAIIDFDTVHPGPRLWDIAYALYRWIPLMNSGNPESFGDLRAQRRRIGIFLDAYSLDGYEFETVINFVLERLKYLVEFIFYEADRGNGQFRKNVEDGHCRLYFEDMKFINDNFK